MQHYLKVSDIVLREMAINNDTAGPHFLFREYFINNEKA